MPYAFTEQGIYMLATVLRGELAGQQSIFIMRAFREMRHCIKQSQQFVTQSEMQLVTTKVSEISVQVAGVVDWKKSGVEAVLFTENGHGKRGFLTTVEEVIRKLVNNPKFKTEIQKHIGNSIEMQVRLDKLYDEIEEEKNEKKKVLTGIIAFSNS